MEWISVKDRKPEGKIFWALTQGRPEIDACDWVIIRILNDEHGDYRTLDYASSYRLPNSYNGQSYYQTIYAWLPLEAIPINDKQFI
jgi:hypothetical protein